MEQGCTSRGLELAGISSPGWGLGWPSPPSAHKLHEEGLARAYVGQRFLLQ